MISFEKLQMEAKFQYMRAETAIQVASFGRPLTNEECLAIIEKSNKWMNSLMEWA